METKTMTFDIQITARKAAAAKHQIASLSNAKRKALLTQIANNLIAETATILEANKLDIEHARNTGLSAAMLDRLLLDKKAIKSIADAVFLIAGQPDFLGAISHLQPMPSGIQVGKMRIPLGVIAMIYESRPNVTIDAAVLCLKSGNAVILRGGKEAQHSNQALAKILKAALISQQLSEDIVTVIPVADREVMAKMLTLSESIDLVIPRGGEGLINYVTEHSRIPVIQHFKGVCHLYVDKAAKLDKALAILENGKTQRTGVCNALETLLVHESVATEFLPLAAKMFESKSVVVHACEKSLAYFKHATLASQDDWEAEYLALEIAVRIVTDEEKAFEHIREYASGHTEVIVTEDFSLAQRFMREVDSSVVMVNASSRFSDGGELGLGAEIGISTSKLHAYGPMGAESLTTEKFIVIGNGSVRQ
ncbi:MAG: glutamate-5-semialdehyde dehydrogenase [Gammaproteobacteria bacterium]|jgi:glutamate-5-semialdehyde dehydrogenase